MPVTCNLCHTSIEPSEGASAAETYGWLTERFDAMGLEGISVF
jgi:hypothetical protein